MEDSEEKLISLTVFQKGERGINVEGTVDSTSPDYMVITDSLGTHAFRKEDISTLILDKPEDLDVSRYTELTKKGYRVFTKSGTQLQFNGWDVSPEITKIFPSVTFAYLSDHDDLILLYEDQKYHYYGKVFPEKPIEPKPAGYVPGKGKQPPKARRT